MAHQLTASTAIVKIHARPINTTPRRLQALDIVRGWAMLLMLISHSSWWLNDLDYGVAYGWDNMIVPQLRFPGSIPGFVMQLATPAFFLLGGFSIALFAASRRRRGWTEAQITRFLAVRGLLLIALDVTVMNLLLSPPYYSAHLSVLTGIGICVLLMAWLRRLDGRALVALLVLVLLGTQLYYHGLTAAGEWPREPSLLRAVLLAPSVEDVVWKTQFPALPWLPVVLLGFVVGARVRRDDAALRKLALRLGLGSLLLFAVVLSAGSFGSLYPANPLIFGKHPPDLGYILLYTGLTWLLIALHSTFTRINSALPLRMVAALGQTALFFYLVHIRVIEMLSPLIAPLPLPPLARSLLIVLAALPLLVLLSVWYRAYKREHPRSVLRYL
jgi:uncharacterized membrane protein